MSFYVPNLDDISEPEPVEDGAYNLVIQSAERRVNDKGVTWINATINFLDPPEDRPRPPAIYHTLFLPAKDAEAWKVHDSGLKLKRFAVFFGLELPDHELTLEEIDEWVKTWPGARAAGKVVKVHNEKQDKYQNELIVPQIGRHSSSNSAARSAPAGLRSV